MVNVKQGRKKRIRKRKKLKKLYNAKALMDQIKQKEMIRLKEKEIIEREGELMKKQIKAMQDEDMRNEEKKKLENSRIAKEIVNINKISILNKNKKKLLEREEDLKRLKYNIAKAKKEEEDINIIKNIQLNDKNQLVFENVDYEKIIYINVLARNLKSNELILYHPIKGIVEMTNTFSKKIFYFIAIFFLCIIIFISYRYYQKEKYNFIGYRLANNSDNQKDDIKYSNISTGIY